MENRLRAMEKAVKLLTTDNRDLKKRVWNSKAFFSSLLLRRLNLRENNAYPPLFRRKWPKHRIDKQKLCMAPSATMFISHIFADILAIIEISETHK